MCLEFEGDIPGSNASRSSYYESPHHVTIIQEMLPKRFSSEELLLELKYSLLSEDICMQHGTPRDTDV